MNDVCLRTMITLLSVVWLCYGCSEPGDNTEENLLKCHNLDCETRRRECVPHTQTEDAFCGDCTQDTYEYANSCFAVTTCAIDEYEAHPPTTTRDRECSPYTVECNENEYEAIPRTETADRSCAPHTECQEDEYEAVAASKTHDRECLPYTVCEPGEREVAAASPTHDRVCEPCGPGYYCPGGSEPHAFCGVLAHEDPTQPCATLVDLQNTSRSVCALDSFGRVFCWGASSHPANIEGAHDFPPLTSIAVGSDGFVCGLEEDGTPHCYGKSNQAALNTPSTLKFKQIAAGHQVVCGVRDDNDAKVHCWAGVGSTPPLMNHPLLTTSYNVKSVAVGRLHACITGPADDLACWHNGSSDLLEIPNDISKVSSINLNWNFSCAILPSKELRCWSDPNAEPGNIPHNPPAGMEEVIDAANETANITAVSTTDTSICAIDTDGELTCWSTNSEPEPLPAGPIKVTAGTCALSEAGYVTCWGTNNQDNIPIGFQESDTAEDFP